MTLITVDPELCTKDGHCVAECPALIIQITDDIPFVTQEMDEFCINCGHCVAVCPAEALTLRTLSPADCLPVNKSQHLSEEQAEHFLRSRRSIRNYKEKTVDREILQKLFDLARHAPTGSNKQPVQWLVIEDSRDVQKIAGMVIDWMTYVIKNDPKRAEEMKFEKLVAAHAAGVDRICRNAPHLAFAYADTSFSNPQTDCAIALTYLELFLPALGLGGCWGGYINAAVKYWKPLQLFLNFPENTECHGVMMIGYPRYRYFRMPLRKEAPVVWR
ncbi:MAG: nitroreductase family protein [SAR324 cluster bacterium]|nr:nitroreductase family protein [SAR324 cluster bacterium]